MVLNKRFLKFQFPALLWALAIFVQSSIPSLSPPSIGISAEDKIAHAIVFAILGYLITRAFYFSENDSLRRNAVILGIIIGLLYGISDEVHQMFVPGRYPEVWDVVADFTGVLLAQVVFRFIKK
ncbi:teicoplanin resistance protein VanZ [candidate division KSB1 bacterium]|nr:teicoplanin resistance protein VanZ [candidate division KSB1 bacterium]